MDKEFFPPDVKEAANKMGGDFLKGSDFEGDGLTLVISKPLEKVKSTNPEYGAQEDEWMVEHEILAVGETFLYSFTTLDGIEKKLNSKSAPFFLGFKACEDLGVGDTVHITRSGKTNKTRYSIEKVSQETSIPGFEGTEPKDIPF